MEGKHFIKKEIMSANILFIDEATFKTRTGVSNAIDGGKQLRPMIKVAQDMFVQPALGSTLYQRLQTAVANSTLNTYERALIDDYITDCLIWATVSYLPVTMGYQFFSKGALQKTSEESNTPGKNELDYIGTYYQNLAEFYKQRIINYLRANSSLFAEYKSPGCGWDVIQPVALGYECPIYLDDTLPCVGSNVSVPGDYAHPMVSVYTAVGGESSFTLTPSILNKTVLLATRSGWTRRLVDAATTDTMSLQRNGNTITLPTGDVAQPGERFEFLYT